MPDPTREQLRSKRKRDVRAKTLSIGRATKAQRARAHRQAAKYDSHRVLPLTRGECEGGSRPCPCVSCKHHLFLDVSPRTGSIKLNYPDLEPWELSPSCALDVADHGELTLEEVGELMNWSRERARQVEKEALGKLRVRAVKLQELREVFGLVAESGGERCK